jgi:hypothetical protein
MYPFLALFASLVFYEIFETLQKGVLIGPDNAEYLFTAYIYLHGQHSIFAYEYPLLPAFYTLIVLALPNPSSAYVASDIVTGLIFCGLFAASYLLFLKDTSSKIGGIVGAFILSSAPLFMDEAGWGGQSQLVAFIFGTLALRRYLFWGQNPRVRDGLFVGLLIAMGALTEGWATAYFVLTLAAAVLLTYRARLFSRNLLLTVGATLVPIAVVYAFLSRVSGSSVQNSLSSPWLFQISLQNYALRLAERFAVGQPLLFAAYLLVVATWFFAYAFNLIPRTERFRILLVPATVAFLIQALILTSTFDGDRGVYFAIIPLALIVARLGGSVRPAISNLIKAEEYSTGIPSRSMREIFRREAPVAASVLVVVIVGVQVGFSGLHLSQALPYYGTPESIVNQLSFLQNETGSVVLLGVGGSAGTFPYLYATGHSVYRAEVQPSFFTKTSQKEGVVNATLLEAGPRWIDGGGVRVADASTVQAESTPGIFVYNGNDLFQAFYLNDALFPFAFSPDGNHSIVYHESPYYAPNQSVSIIGADSLAAHYAWNTVNISKTVEILSNGTVMVRLDLQFIKSFDRDVEVRLFCGEATTVESTTQSAHAISVGVSQEYSTQWDSDYFPSTISLTQSNISFGSFEFVPADQWGIPELQFMLTTNTTIPQNVQINLTIQPHGVVSTHSTVYTEAEWYQSIGAKWIVVQKSGNSVLLTRLNRDPVIQLFKTTTRFEIFQVIG